MIHNQMGFYYEDFLIGTTIKHCQSKTIFESDNNLFCLLTMNHHPAHINMDYATREMYGKILVVGPLVLSLVVGLTVMDLSGKAIANLGYDEVRHLRPTFIGDTLYARSEILNKRISASKPDRGILSVKTFGYNQYAEDVISFKRDILLKRKSTI